MDRGTKSNSSPPGCQIYAMDNLCGRSRTLIEVNANRQPLSRNRLINAIMFNRQ